MERKEGSNILIHQVSRRKFFQITAANAAFFVLACGSPDQNTQESAKLGRLRELIKEEEQRKRQEARKEREITVENLEYVLIDAIQPSFFEQLGDKNYYFNLASLDEAELSKFLDRFLEKPSPPHPSKRKWMGIRLGPDGALHVDVTVLSQAGETAERRVWGYEVRVNLANDRAPQLQPFVEIGRNGRRLLGLDKFREAAEAFFILPPGMEWFDTYIPYRQSVEGDFPEKAGTGIVGKRQASVVVQADGNTRLLVSSHSSKRF